MARKKSKNGQARNVVMRGTKKSISKGAKGEEDERSKKVENEESSKKVKKLVSN